MGIWAPVLDVLGWVAGTSWPAGDEDGMYGLSGDWSAAASSYRAAMPGVAAAKSQTQAAYPQGAGGAQMVSVLDQLHDDLDRIAQICDSNSDSCNQYGEQIESAKMMMITSLELLAFDLAAAWAAGPFAPAVDAGEIAATRVTVEIIAKRLAEWLIEHVVKQAAISAMQNLLIQAMEVMEGHLKDINWGEVGISAAVGGAGGLAGGLGHGLLSNALDDVLKDGAGKLFKDGLGSVVAGGAGAVGGWAASGALTGNWQFSPQMLVSGAVMGMMGTANHELVNSARDPIIDGLGTVKSLFGGKDGGLDDIPTTTMPDTPHISAESPEAAVPQPDRPASSAAADNGVATDDVGAGDTSGRGDSGQPQPEATSGQPQAEQPTGDQPQGDQSEAGQPQGEPPQNGQHQDDQTRGDQPQDQQPQGDTPEGSQLQGDQPQGRQPQGEQPQEGQQPAPEQTQPNTPSTPVRSRDGTTPPESAQPPASNQAQPLRSDQGAPQPVSGRAGDASAPGASPSGRAGSTESTSTEPRAGTADSPGSSGEARAVQASKTNAPQAERASVDETGEGARAAAKAQGEAEPTGKSKSAQPKADEPDGNTRASKLEPRDNRSSETKPGTRESGNGKRDNTDPDESGKSTRRGPIKRLDDALARRQKLDNLVQKLAKGAGIKPEPEDPRSLKEKVRDWIWRDDLQQQAAEHAKAEADEQRAGDLVDATEHRDSLAADLDRLRSDPAATDEQIATAREQHDLAGDEVRRQELRADTADERDQLDALRTTIGKRLGVTDRHLTPDHLDETLDALRKHVTDRQSQRIDELARVSERYNRVTAQLDRLDARQDATAERDAAAANRADSPAALIRYWRAADNATLYDDYADAAVNRRDAQNEDDGDARDQAAATERDLIHQVDDLPARHTADTAADQIVRALNRAAATDIGGRDDESAPKVVAGLPPRELVAAGLGREDGHSGTASNVGDFRGDSRSGDSVLTQDQVQQELESTLLLVKPDGMAWNPDQKVFVMDDGRTISIRVADRTLPDEVARFTERPGRDGYDIEISPRARTVDVPRAVAHELAEIRLAQQPGIDRDPDADHTDHLTAHLGGRYAELKVLESEIDAARLDPAKGRQLEGLLSDRDDLLDHLGLRGEGPDGDLRRQLLIAHDRVLAERAGLTGDGVEFDRPVIGRDLSVADYQQRSAEHLAHFDEQVTGEYHDQLLRVEKMSLDARMREELVRRIFDPIYADPDALEVTNRFKRDLISALDPINEAVNRPDLTPLERVAATHRAIDEFRDRMPEEFREAFGADRFAKIYDAVRDLAGFEDAGGRGEQPVSGVLDRDSNEVRIGGRRMPLADLLHEVDQANRGARENNLNLEYVIVDHGQTPEGHSVFEVSSRPRPQHALPLEDYRFGPGHEKIPLAPREPTTHLTDGGRFIVDVGTGRSGFPEEMMPAGDRGHGNLVLKTELSEGYAVPAQRQRGLGILDPGPLTEPGSLMVYGDLLFGGKVLGDGETGAIGRLLLNNVNAKFDDAAYDALAGRLPEIMAPGGRIEVQWDMKSERPPDDPRGRPGDRGHITGDELMQAIRRVLPPQIARRFEVVDAETLEFGPEGPKDYYYSIQAAKSNEVDPGKLAGFTPPIPDHRMVIVYTPEGYREPESTGIDPAEGDDGNHGAALNVGQFRGNARTDDAELTPAEVHREIAENEQIITPAGVRWDPNRQVFVMHQGDVVHEITVRVADRPLPETVAEFTRDGADYHIEISPRAATEHVARAIAHELAEIGLAENPAVRTDSADEIPDTLTSHLGGRYAELKVLDTQLTRALEEPARASELPGLRRDLADLMNRLGLRPEPEFGDRWAVLNEYDPDLSDVLGRYLEPAAARPAEIGLLHEQLRAALGEEAHARRTSAELRARADGDPEHAQELRERARTHEERSDQARARAREARARLIELERAEDADAMAAVEARRSRLEKLADNRLEDEPPTGHPFDIPGSESFGEPTFLARPLHFHKGLLMAHLLERPAEHDPSGTGEHPADGSPLPDSDIDILEDPTKLHELWSGLSQAEKEEFYRADPFIGNRDGIPQMDRDSYNRRTLDWLRDTARDANDTERLKQYDEIAEMLDPAKQEEGQPGLYLSYIDHNVRFAYALGNPDTADNVAIVVKPAVGAWNRNGVRYAGETLTQIRRAARSADPIAETSVILWGGYDNPPALAEAAFSHYAESGAEAARRFHEGLRVTHEGPPSLNTTIGHSYGGVVSGHAAGRGNSLNTDNVIFLGAPGTGAAHVGELSLTGISPEDTGTHVFASVARYDSIQLFPDVHGPSPTDPAFGAAVFTTDSTPSEHPSQWNPKDHTAPVYLGRNNASFRHIGRIITGSWDELR